jgi:hypothetical protein
MTMKFTTTALALAAFVGLSGCTAQNLCAKKAECADEEGDDLADDSPSVCQANYNGNLNALRANEEEECQILANAQEALDACRAGLTCDDFFKSDFGGECDDQVDDYEDALNDIDGFECSAQEE